jgi:hypothetical protein
MCRRRMGIPRHGADEPFDGSGENDASREVAIPRQLVPEPDGPIRPTRRRRDSGGIESTDDSHNHSRTQE